MKGSETTEIPNGHDLRRIKFFGSSPGGSLSLELSAFSGLTTIIKYAL